MWPSHETILRDYLVPLGSASAPGSAHAVVLAGAVYGILLQYLDEDLAFVEIFWNTAQFLVGRVARVSKFLDQLDYKVILIWNKELVITVSLVVSCGYERLVIMLHELNIVVVSSDSLFLDNVGGILWSAASDEHNQYSYGISI